MQEKSSKSTKSNRTKDRITRIQERIALLDYVCSGTVVTSMNTCGKPNCRCATDPAAKHGPYYQWNRMKGGKLIHRTVSRQQAAQLRRAIRNYRAIQRLLRVWEEKTAKLLNVKHRPK